MELFSNHIDKTYTVYSKSESEDPLDAHFVQEGFVIWMFVPFINLFWALQRKCWLLLTLIVFTYYVLFFTGANNDFLSSNLVLNGIVFSKLYIFLRLIVLIFLGVNANDFWRKSLERRGYEIVEIVAATNEAEAQRRYFQIVANEIKN